MKTALIALTALLLTACGAAHDAHQEPAPTAIEQANAHDVFIERLHALCGQRFEGRITADEPPPKASDPFADQRLVMDVRDCGNDEIRIRFHVGADHSRTWIITRTAEGLRLKHDHRLADGSEDPITMYGGDTVDQGTPTRQSFPADAESRALFTAHDMAISNTNTWSLEIEPAEHFTYELARPARLFRVRFDLTTPTPPEAQG